MQEANTKLNKTKTTTQKKKEKYKKQMLILIFTDGLLLEHSKA